jgi:hypothetical protein
MIGSDQLLAPLLTLKFAMTRVPIDWNVKSAVLAQM